MTRSPSSLTLLAALPRGRRWATRESGVPVSVRHGRSEGEGAHARLTVRVRCGSLLRRRHRSLVRSLAITSQLESARGRRAASW